MAVLRYKNDVREGLPKVLGGKWKVIDAVYDEEKNVTLVEVAPLRDPFKALGL